MPRARKVTEAEKVEIVKQKRTARKTQAKIAKDTGRSQAVVSSTHYEDLSDEGKAEVDKYCKEFELRMTRLRHKSVDKAENLVDSVPDDDPSYLPQVIGALKISDDIVRKIQGLPTEIHETRERRTAADIANEALNELESKGWDRAKARKAVADKFRVDIRLLKE